MLKSYQNKAMIIVIFFASSWILYAMDRDPESDVTPHNHQRAQSEDLGIARTSEMLFIMLGRRSSSGAIGSPSSSLSREKQSPLSTSEAVPPCSFDNRRKLIKRYSRSISSENLYGKDAVLAYFSQLPPYGEFVSKSVPLARPSDRTGSIK
jgi:hypothetical protein